MPYHVYDWVQKDVSALLRAVSSRRLSGGTITGAYRSLRPGAEMVTGGAYMVILRPLMAVRAEGAVFHKSAWSRPDIMNHSILGLNSAHCVQLVKLSLMQVPILSTQWTSSATQMRKWGRTGSRGLLTSCRQIASMQTQSYFSRRSQR